MQSDASSVERGELRNQAKLATRLLRRAAAPEKRHLAIATLWLILAAAFEVLGPLLGKALIDDHLLPRELDWPRMALLLGGLVVTGWIASWVRYLQLIRLSGLAMRSVQRLREWVYGHVLRLPMAFFDRAITGQLVSRVTNDTEAVKTLYIQVLYVMLDNSIVLIGTMIAMAWLDWRLMLIVLALVPAVAGIVWLYQRLSAPAVTRARALRSDINGQMAESIGGMSVLQASNAEVRFGERFLGTNRNHYTARLAELRANAFLLRPALDLLNVALLALVIFAFGQREVGAVEVGVLYAFVSYIARVVEPLIQITMQFSGLQQAVVAAARVNTLLDEAGAPEHDVGRMDGENAFSPDAPAVSDEASGFVLPRLGWPRFDAAHGRLAETTLFRGVADCGHAASWRWDGRQFQIETLQLQRNCIGGEPGDWPLLWRSVGGPTNAARQYGPLRAE